MKYKGLRCLKKYEWLLNLEFNEIVQGQPVWAAAHTLPEQRHGGCDKQVCLKNAFEGNFLDQILLVS